MTAETSTNYGDVIGTSPIPEDFWRETKLMGRETISFPMGHEDWDMTNTYRSSLEKFLNFIVQYYATHLLEKSLYETQNYDFVSERLEKLENDIQLHCDNKPTSLVYQIYGLPVANYTLKQPLNIIMEIYSDEVLAIFPDLELYGEGKNEFEAISDLKYEFIDLFDELNSLDNEQLAEKPLAWKNIINNLISKQ